jgi:glutamine amidotransferase
MLGYLGEPVRLSELIERPPHSLEHQSYAARELRGAVVCADGWGAGFYVPDDPEPCLYRSTLPIWADCNRSQLGRAILTRCLLACVRSATDPLSVSVANTPPFSMGSLLLTHNGYVENFSNTLAREFEQRLAPETYGLMKGRTDSEYLLALVADVYSRIGGEPSPARLLAATQAAARQVLELSARTRTRTLLSLILSDGHCLVALRAAFGDAPPSLYFADRHSGSARGVIVASEPLDSPGEWLRIEPGEAWLLTADGTRQQARLL